MSWWPLLYVGVLVVLIALGGLALWRGADDGRMVARKGVTAPEEKPLLAPLPKRARAALQARVAQVKQATPSLQQVKAVQAKMAPRIPGRLRPSAAGTPVPDQAVPRQAVPADAPETAAAAED